MKEAGREWDREGVGGMVKEGGNGRVGVGGRVKEGGNGRVREREGVGE